jgi:hypothetical protein
LGHTLLITDKGPSIKVQKSKIEAMSALKPPKNAKELKSMVGAFIYLSTYVESLQILLAPLHKLCRKGSKWEWTKIHDDNFKKIINKLLPVIKYCNYHQKKENMFYMWIHLLQVLVRPCAKFRMVRRSV